MNFRQYNVKTFLEITEAVSDSSGDREGNCHALEVLLLSRNYFICLPSLVLVVVVVVVECVQLKRKHGSGFCSWDE